TAVHMMFCSGYFFGILTCISANAIYTIMSVFATSLSTVSTQNFLGITFAQFLCFMFFWCINMLVVYKGIDCIRWLLNIKAPLLIALGLMLLWWAYRNAGGFGPILAQPSAFAPGQPKAGQFFSFFVPALTGMIGFWATLSLNIPDCLAVNDHRGGSDCDADERIERHCQRQPERLADDLIALRN